MIEDVTALDKKVFEAYIKRKSDSLQGIIEHGMNVGYFDWEHAGDPSEVRSYVREILMHLVLIHAEVYAVSALIVPRVMHELVSILSKEFLDCISEVECFNVNGIIHVSVYHRVVRCGQSLIQVLTLVWSCQWLGGRGNYVVDRAQAWRV
jgi:exocyst complex component 2